MRYTRIFFINLLIISLTSCSNNEPPRSVSNPLLNNGNDIKLSKKQARQLEEMNKQSGPALQGFEGLTFWSIPSHGNRPKESKAAFIQKLSTLLEKKGKITIINEEKGLDFKGFQTEAIVYLNNLPIIVQDLSNHKDEYIKNTECINLKVITPIIIQKNGKHSQADIYERSICVTTSRGTDVIDQAALDLISGLLTEFFSANPMLEGKAQFFIYD